MNIHKDYIGLRLKENGDYVFLLLSLTCWCMCETWEGNQQRFSFPLAHVPSLLLVCFPLSLLQQYTVRVGYNMSK